MKQLSLRDVRRRRGLTQAQLETLSGVEQEHISKLELGKIARPSADTVSKLETALKVKPRTLIFPGKAVAA